MGKFRMWRIQKWFYRALSIPKGKPPDPLSQRSDSYDRKLFIVFSPDCASSTHPKVPTKAVNQDGAQLGIDRSDLQRHCPEYYHWDLADCDAKALTVSLPCHPHSDMER
jgi:hypothetical protein